MLKLDISVPNTEALPIAGAAAQADPQPMGTKVWTEVRPSLQQRSTMTWSADSGAVTLEIKVLASQVNLRAVLSYCVGYSQVVKTGNATAQNPYGTWRLSRKTPARHPWLQGLFCTKILSVTGMGNREVFGYDALPAGSGGTMGQWDVATITLLFELPNYDILTDAQNSTDGNDPPTNPLPEYLRMTRWEGTELCETIARKGVQWTFLDPAARGVTPGSKENSNQRGVFPGERILRQAKSSLKVTTYDVAIDWVYWGRFIPANGLRALARVNSRAFPYYGYPDKTTGIVGRARAGTALVMPSLYKSRAQAHPAVMSGQISADLLPLTVDVERNFAIFDPACTDLTYINLNIADGYGDVPPVMLNGNAQTLVRGHNLAPTPAPIPAGQPQAGSQWFVPANTQFPVVTGGSGLFGNLGDAAIAAARGSLTPSQLLYGYTDVEQLWQSPIPLPTG